MENIKAIKAYTLVNANGISLTMRLGKGTADEYNRHDQGWRWMCLGTQIPFPVRNGTWFNGFPEATMMNWLMDNGWTLQAVVNMATGRAKVYDTNKANAVPEYLASMGEVAMIAAVKLLWDNGKHLKAINLLRYHRPWLTVGEAKDAVETIVNADA